jgi:hypothetical protein
MVVSHLVGAGASTRTTDEPGVLDERLEGRAS